jgi:sulfide:quinone oxidoreductase
MGTHAKDARVLIAGGGVAALEAALALQALAGDLVSTVLLAPEPQFWYRPPAVAEPFGLGEARHFELSALAAELGAELLQGELVSVDAGRRLAHTAPGGPVPYDALLIACGALPRVAVPGAITFRGPADTPKIEQLLAELEAGVARSAAFVVPVGAVWSLPAYELALMTARWLVTHGVDGVSLALVTPEDEPLGLFGRDASTAVRGLLEERGIEIHTRAYPTEARPGELFLVPEGIIETDRVVALPRLAGPRIDGIPQTFEGFVPVDAHGRVPGIANVYAAGDITTFPVKQGGIATQQASAAAQAIAADFGAEVTPRPFRPVLRGLLVTGLVPSYLRAEPGPDADSTSQASQEPLWWPPAKIVGHYLAPFLARMAGTPEAAELPSDIALPVEVELDTDPRGQRRDLLLEEAVAATAAPTDVTAGDLMSGDPLVVAPEDTLGEVAEAMCRRDLGSALVCDYGRLIGIVTSRDLLRAVAARLHSSEARVREWMTAEPIAVSRGTTVEAAELLMAEHGIHHLPVVEGERPVGMLGARDLEGVTGRSAASAAQIGART